MRRRGDQFFANYILTILGVIIGLMILGKIGSWFSSSSSSSYSTYSSSSKYHSTSRYSGSSGSSGGSRYSGSSTTTYKSTPKPVTKSHTSYSKSSSSSSKKERTVDPMDHDIESYYLDYQDEFENEDDAWDDFEDDPDVWDDY